VVFALCRSPKGASNPLFDRGYRLSGHPGNGLNFSFQDERLIGGIAVPGRSRQRPRAFGRRSLTAGDWHGFPRHLDAWCIGKLCMGLILRFFPRPWAR
jgi:hypothetical protein